MLPKLAPTLLRFCKQPCRARFCGLRQSVLARLFVEPLGFEPVFGQPRGVFDRIVRQKIRVSVEALEFRDVAPERGLRRSFLRAEYRGPQRPPRRLAARPRLGNAIGRGQRAASRKPGEATGRFTDLLFHRLPRSCGFAGPTRAGLKCVGKMMEVLAPWHRNSRQRFEVDDRRIEPRGGVGELESILGERDPTVSNPPRLIGDLAEGRIFLAQRRGIEVRPVRLLRSARRLVCLLRLGELTRLRVRQRFSVPPLLDQLARLRLRGFRWPPRFQRTDIGHT